jgi:bile acid-coenzyme A ligase
MTSLSKVFEELARQDPHRKAVSCGEVSVDRAQLDALSNQLARVYQELGVAQDRLVTIALPNSVEFVLSVIAVWKCGATPQAVSYRLPDHELREIIELSDPALIVGVDAARSFGRASLPAGFEPPQDTSADPLPERIANAWKAPTSGGSTGRPKVILATRPATLDEAGALAQGQRRDRVVFVPGPMYHNGPFACAMRGLTIGNHLVLCPRFDAENTLRLIEKERVDWILLVPTMMARIWRLPEEVRIRYDLSSLRYVLHFGAPTPPWLKEAWINWLGADRIFELFGPSEAQGATRINGHEWLAHRGSVGRPIPGCEVAVFGQDGNQVPSGQVGTIYMRTLSGKSNYRYIGAEAERLPGGWETVGDLGWFDHDGFLYFADRRTDMIVTGGANVYPAEVEAALAAHPLVRDCAVIGLPDDDLGQRVHAIVQAEAPVSAEDLRAHLAGLIARYKIPRTFEAVRVSLRDEGGKARRSGLRAERTGNAG